MWRIFWKIVFLSLSLTTINCSRTFHEEFIKDVEIYSGKEKVALVGFYPFKVSEFNRGILKNEIIVEQDYDNSLKEKFIHPVVDLSDKKVKEKNLKNSKNAIVFYSGYLKEVGKSGYPELSKVLELRSKNFIQKHSDIDYYVVAVFGPDFSEKVPSAINGLSNIFSLLTLGIIPARDEYLIYANFYIFDKNLKPINGIMYQSKYKVITAIWMVPDKNFDTFFSTIYTGRKEVYKEFVDKFNYDYPNLIHKKGR